MLYWLLLLAMKEKCRPTLYRRSHRKSEQCSKKKHLLERTSELKDNKEIQLQNPEEERNSDK